MLDRARPDVCNPRWNLQEMALIFPIPSDRRRTTAEVGLVPLAGGLSSIRKTYS
jgi:hypothetical protein